MKLLQNDFSTESLDKCMNVKLRHQTSKTVKTYCNASLVLCNAISIGRQINLSKLAAMGVGGLGPKSMSEGNFLSISFLRC